MQIKRLLVSGLHLIGVSRRRRHSRRGCSTYNFDKTRFMIGIIFVCMVVTTSDGHIKAKLAQSGNREWQKVIQGVNVQGWAIPPSIILGAQFHLTN
jgi:hypothetical protein